MNSPITYDEDSTDTTSTKPLAIALTAAVILLAVGGVAWKVHENNKFIEQTTDDILPVPSAKLP